MIVRFVDIGGIVDHYCLNCLFIIVLSGKLFVLIMVGFVLIRVGFVLIWVGFGIPLTGLTLPHYSACPRSGPGLLTTYVVVFFYVQ